MLAGTIAGSLFRIEARLSVFCAIVLGALVASAKNAASETNVLLRLIAAMLACTLVGYFALQPSMASLRTTAGAAGIMATDNKMQFAIRDKLVEFAAYKRWCYGIVIAPY